MLEIVFSESSAGLLQEAKKQRLFPGSPEDVLCLPFMLDIGDIRQPVNSEYRKKLLFYGWDITDTDMEKRWQLAIDANKRLIASVKKGEPVRIWYSNTPYSLCGLYYVCHLLQPYIAPISTVKMPEYIRREDGCLISYSGWYEVFPDLWKSFLPYEYRLNSVEIRHYGSMWQDLIKDNIVNGTLISVPEDFYDFLLYKFLTKESVRQIMIIGDVIGHYHGGIPAWVYAVRIDKLIADGKIEVVQDASRKYDRLIRLAD